jgi:hypothetical protein
MVPSGFGPPRPSRAGRGNPCGAPRRGRSFYGGAESSNPDSSSEESAANLNEHRSSQLTIDEFSAERHSVFYPLPGNSRTGKSASSGAAEPDRQREFELRVSVLTRLVEERPQS